jgi:hypothetical protein
VRRQELVAARQEAVPLQRLRRAAPRGERRGAGHLRDVPGVARAAAAGTQSPSRYRVMSAGEKGLLIIVVFWLIVLVLAHDWI